MKHWITKVPTEVKQDIMARAQLLVGDIHRQGGEIVSNEVAEALDEWLRKRHWQVRDVADHGLRLDSLLIPVKVAIHLIAETEMVDHEGHKLGSLRRDVGVECRVSDEERWWQRSFIDNIPVERWAETRDRIYDRADRSKLDRIRAERIDGAVQRQGCRSRTVGEACRLDNLDLDRMVI